MPPGNFFGEAKNHNLISYSEEEIENEWEKMLKSEFGSQKKTEIEELAKKVGFRNIENIPFEERRIELAKKFAVQSLPEPLRERIKISIAGSNALMIKK